MYSRRVGCNDAHAVHVRGSPACLHYPPRRLNHPPPLLQGREVGAVFVESVCLELKKCLDGTTNTTWSSATAFDGGKSGADEGGAGDGKGDAAGTSRRAPNLVLLLAGLYNLGVVQCGLVYDLVTILAERLTPLDVELLLLLLSEVGPQLRADDSTALKDIVDMVRKNKAVTEQQDDAAVGKSESATSGGEEGWVSSSTRLRFMFEELERLQKKGTGKQRGAGGGNTAELMKRMRKLIQRFKGSSRLVAWGHGARFRLSHRPPPTARPPTLNLTVHCPLSIARAWSSRASIWYVEQRFSNIKQLPATKTTNHEAQTTSRVQLTTVHGTLTRPGPTS